MATAGKKFIALSMVATSLGLIASAVPAEARHHHRDYSSPLAPKGAIAENASADAKKSADKRADEKADARAANKSEPRKPEKSEAHASEKSDVCSAEKSVERSAQKSVERSAQKSEERAADATKKKGETIKAKVSDKAKPADKSETVAVSSSKHPSTPASASRAAASTMAAVQETSESAQLMDTALLSILRDLSKAARESDDVQKLDDPAQKAAVEAALQALDASLEREQIHPNRIVATAQKDHFEKKLTAESWESGMILLPDRTHASLNVLWAKKVNGLINITIAGTFKHTGEKGAHAGQYVVVLGGRSVLDSGFDIQSQSNVNYWLGKLTTVSVDALAGEAAAAQSPSPVLKALLTDDWMKRKSLSERAVAAAGVSPAKKPDSTGGASVVAAGAANGTDIDGRSVVAREAASGDEAVPDLRATVGSSESESSARRELTPAPEVSAPQEVSVPARSDERNEVASAASGTAEAAETRAQAAEPSTNANAGAPAPATAVPQPEAARSQASSQPATALRPSAGAHPIAPERAIAGENVTVAIVDAQGRPEPFVEVSFNGNVVVSGRDGKATYMVPEDAIPGPTLQVSLKERPEAGPVAVYVLQPLIRPQSAELPKIDRISNLVTAGSTIIIEGHNFDGIADHNRVLLEGGKEAPVVVSSPVQLRAQLPSSVTPGQHVLAISTNGLRSNAGRYELIAVSIETLGNREKANKFVVKVLGTQSKVKLKLQNDSPELIKLVKGSEFVTPGGANNLVTVNAQRLGRGVFRVSANIEGTQ